jgi:hypothetical protein
MYEFNTGEVTKGWSKLREEHRYLYSSPSITRVGLVGHMARMTKEEVRTKRYHCVQKKKKKRHAEHRRRVSDKYSARACTGYGSVAGCYERRTNIPVSPTDYLQGAESFLRS